MNELLAKYKSAAEYIKKQCTDIGQVAVISGTGLGGAIDQLKNKKIISYQVIPYFPKTTVESHSGNLILGELKGKKVAFLQGRFHYYEGHEMDQVTFPIRVLKLLGIKTVILTNAAGSVNPAINPGSFMVLKDHINFLPVNPLRGKNIDELGVRFPDMTNVYDLKLRQEVLDYCKKESISCHSGVYLALQGPSLETPAELLFFNRMGADVVGMSTVPEVIVARHMAMKVVALSVVTNQGYPNPDKHEASIEEVLEVAKEVTPKLNKVIGHLISVT